MAKDYSEYSKEDLLNYIMELESQLKEKKYGLSWDTGIEKEYNLNQCIDNIPLLEENEELKLFSTDNNVNNILIEGDNFHSLSILKMMSNGNGFIDAIYIDPPYNTGKKNFIYNDKYVDKEDGYRHSKWLSFMKNRLILARDILCDDGVIFISIDDHEQANLKLLLDSVFGEDNFLANIMVKANPRGRQSSSYFAQVHDYLLVYRKTKECTLNGFKLDEEVIRKRFNHVDEQGRPYEEWELRKRGAASRRIDVPNLWYPIYFNESTNELSLDQTEGFDIEILPFLSDGTDGRWRWGKDKFQKEKDSLYARKNNKGIYNVYERKYIKDKSTQLAPTIWDYQDVNTELGTEALKQTTTQNVDFDYPKPVGLIKRILQLIPKENPVVLDFFAGSGTTGQAVLELNKEDGKERKFILCTNNENNICTDITYLRLKTVLTGIRIDGTRYSDGIDSNLIYFKTNFITASKNTDQAKYCLAEKVDKLLCILEDMFVKLERNDYLAHYSSNDGSRHMFIYSDFYNEEKFICFKDIINRYQGEKIVYMFSPDNTIDYMLFDELKDIEVKPIPSKIYEIYKEIVEDIKRG